MRTKAITLSVLMGLFVFNFTSAADDSFEVLQQGPIHEAFLEVISSDPQSGELIDRAPPEPIHEVPPDARPAGESVQWIPGYWFWDAGKSDFVWVSGVWRDVPPGRRFVPGYWAQADGGYQWVSGYWAGTEEAAQYLPMPPESLEQGPNSPQPSIEHFWNPGCWVWQSPNYAWRPGFWSRMRPGWMWVPSRYLYTPRGAIFVDGFWDYPLARRGFLYPSVYFPSSFYAQTNFVYRPTSVLEVGLLMANLFASPRQRHYYYGDYIGPANFNRGLYPWYSFGPRRGGYDPFFPYYRWQNEKGPKVKNWARDIVAHYQRDVNSGAQKSIGDRKEFGKAFHYDARKSARAVDMGKTPATMLDKKIADDYRRDIDNFRRMRADRAVNEQKRAGGGNTPFGDMPKKSIEPSRPAGKQKFSTKPPKQFETGKKPQSVVVPKSKPNFAGGQSKRDDRLKGGGKSKGAGGGRGGGKGKK